MCTTDRQPVRKWDSLGRKGHSSSSSDMVQFLRYSQLAAQEYFSAPLSVLAAPQASMCKKSAQLAISETEGKKGIFQPFKPIAFIDLISVVVEVDLVPQSKVNTYVWEGF